MPPIIEQYAEIKRRMEELANPPRVEDRTVGELATRIFASGGWIPPITGGTSPRPGDSIALSPSIPDVGTFCQIGERIYRVKRVDGDKITLWPPLRASIPTPEGRALLEANVESFT